MPVQAGHKPLYFVQQLIIEVGVFILNESGQHHYGIVKAIFFVVDQFFLDGYKCGRQCAHLVERENEEIADSGVFVPLSNALGLVGPL
jgi:hypothetical protein